MIEIADARAVLVTAVYLHSRTITRFRYGNTTATPTLNLDR